MLPILAKRQNKSTAHPSRLWIICQAKFCKMPYFGLNKVKKLKRVCKTRCYKFKRESVKKISGPPRSNRNF